MIVDVQYKSDLRSTAQGDAVLAAVNQAIMRYTAYASGIIRETWRTFDHIATGYLIRSASQFGTDVRGDDVVGWLGMAEYWDHIEFGQPPGTDVPVSTGTHGGLIRWVREKHLAAKTWKAEGGGRIGAFLTLRRPRKGAATQQEGRGLTFRAIEGKDRIGKPVKVKMGQKDRAELRNLLERREWQIAWSVHNAILKDGTEPRPALGTVGPTLQKLGPALLAEIRKCFSRRHR